MGQIDGGRNRATPATPPPARETTPGLSIIPPGSIAGASVVSGIAMKTFVWPSVCGVTNRRGIRPCHQILTSNSARTDQLHRHPSPTARVDLTSFARDHLAFFDRGGCPSWGWGRGQSARPLAPGPVQTEGVVCFHRPVASRPRGAQHVDRMALAPQVFKAAGREIGVAHGRLDARCPR